MAKAKIHHGYTEAALHFAAVLIFRALQARGVATSVLLPGGSSIVGVFQHIVELAADSEWQKLLPLLHLFVVDEFQPTDERPLSNWAVIERHLIVPLAARNLLKAEQLHPFRFTADRQDDCRRYTDELMSVGGAHVVVCCAGGGEFPDGAKDPGHIAGLFPNFPEVWNSEQLFAAFTGAPKPPSERVTATPKLFRQSEQVVAVLRSSARMNVWRNYCGSEPAEVVPLKLIDEVPHAYLCTDVLSGG